jgi:hypothetical protein
MVDKRIEPAAVLPCATHLGAAPVKAPRDAGMTGAAATVRGTTASHLPSPGPLHAKRRRGVVCASPIAERQG